MNNKHGEINVAFLFEQAGWLHTLARSLVGDSHRAEDLMQDAFLTAVEKPPRGVAESSVLQAWLAKVTRNLALSTARGQRHRAAREETAARPEQLPSVAEAVERTELRQQLMDAILGLASPYREVVILRYLEGLSTRQVAERTGASKRAVRTRLSRGLGMLRARLDEEHEGDRRAWMAILLPLARQGEGLTAGGATMSTGLLMAKVLGALAAAAAVVVLAWMGLARFHSTGEEPTSTPSVEVASGVAGRGTDEAEPTETASLQVEDAGRGLAREPARLPLRSQQPTIEMRPELPPGDPDHDQAHRYKYRDKELLLGPPHFFALEAASRDEDYLGYPALLIQMTEESRAAFASWTAKIVDQKLVILLDDEVISAVRVAMPLTGSTLQVSSSPGGYSDEEVRSMLTRLGFPPATFEPYTFYGVVVEAGDGDPILDPRLELYDGSSAGRVLADGLFQVPVENRSLEIVFVEADGHAPVVVVLSPEHDTPASALVVDLVKTASLELRVTDGDGSPVAGAFIRLFPGTSSSTLRPRWSPREPKLVSSLMEGITTESGSLHQQGLVPEIPIHVVLFRSREAWKEGESLLRKQEVILSPGEQRSVELVLPTQRSLRGRVVDSRGESLPGVEVQLVRHRWNPISPVPSAPDRPRSFSSISDANGLFLFEHLPEGPCWFGVAPKSKVLDAEGAPLAARWRALLLDGATSAGEITLELVPALPIGGVVVDAQGEPVEGLTVTALEETGTWGGVTHTDEKGAFRFEPLPPGRYELEADGASAVTLDDRLVEAGERQVRLLHAPCTIGVTVAGVPNLRDVGIEAVLYPALERDPGGGEFHLMSDGQLRRSGLSPGTYHVVVRSRDGQVGVATDIELGVERRQVDLQLELGPGIPLEIRLGDGISGPHRYQVHLGRALVAGGRVGDGVPGVQLVPPGSLRVQLLDSSGTMVATKQLEAVVGREALVELGGR